MSRYEFRFTKQELIDRERAEKVLRDPDATLWQVSRAKAILRDTEAAARARQNDANRPEAAAVEPQVAIPQPSKPKDPAEPERQRGDRERGQMFLDALRTGGPWPNERYWESLRAEKERIKNRRAGL